MAILSKAFIQNNIADTALIFQRGESIYHHGSYFLSRENSDGSFVYEVDGSYGNYTTQVAIKGEEVLTSCNCPYPGDGCKHVVAALLNARELLLKREKDKVTTPNDDDPYLSEDEIRQQALADRKKRAATEPFTVIQGDMFKGDHLVVNKNNREYCVTLHNPEQGIGHCTCPDYLTNGLGTCKHIQFLVSHLEKEPGFARQLSKERFPFADVYWNSQCNAPQLFSERLDHGDGGLKSLFEPFFDENGQFKPGEISEIMTLVKRVDGDKRVRIRETLLNRVDRYLQGKQLDELSLEAIPEPSLKAKLYPYQEEGVRFGVFKAGVLIGDEMGLGKTLQAIALGVLKREIFGFSKIVVVTLSSLKEQWKREIERFSSEKALVIEGSPLQRKAGYKNDDALFKITNYEAVLRDVTILSNFRPDIIILDEAQRIKNFSTKTADAVKRIPRRHAIVLTGTPLENKLEDVYSIVQFLDPDLLTPLWRFAADHFLLLKNKNNSIGGYRNLDLLKEKLKGVVIRRKKEEVLKDLPREVVNNYYIDLNDEQLGIHGGYARTLAPLLNKKYLTPMDIRRIQVLLLRMRMVCNSTYLIDRETHISPKLKELDNIIDELVVQNRRKMVIFSEWTTMTFLIAKHLSDMGIEFVELSGKVAVKKRQNLIDEFTNNPQCRVFLSTDAGGTGLNLQAADCVVNFELPWNPAKMNQRIGRVSRIGQASQCINVINLIAKNSIEERILAGIQLKTDLFKGVFDDDGPDQVAFSKEKRDEMLNRLRSMMGEPPEPDQEKYESVVPEEIPEDTPGYLNPEVLSRGETDEEALDEVGQRPTEEDTDGAAGVFKAQSPEKIETVLNSGMAFISGLMEMATGQKMETAQGQDKMITIDRQTGEVTMKFKFPGF
ncbi:Helicase, Snf2 family [Desulforapulum autotrophicum HRM2]|uniref:Helicase, Snf2 family n=1 Tax=Desulforapulum autotrophicum (strain ATCC 43914 / DSM 3382 / VKM B-1955 / HRM2) TaxID=177437 RepID=C0QG17_DESAH|nr:DEAD/DEAH box helicase [Desulforapulum autotrophicum]ACN17596.1 Helicase, Snf2 family [Desulforapulum autotrophicum HRM2]